MAGHTEEILVHVDAPSGVRDDAAYRSLVDAYLGFESISRQCVYGAVADNESENEANLDATVEDLTSSLSSASDQPRSQNNHDETCSVNSGDELQSLLAPHESKTPATIQYYSTEEDSELSFQAPIPYGYQASDGEKRNSLAHTNHNSPEIHHNNTSPLVQSANTESLTWDTPLDTIPDSQPVTPPPEDVTDQTGLESIQVDRSYVPDTIRQSKRFRVENADGGTGSDINDETRIPSSVASSPSSHESDQSEPAARRQHTKNVFKTSPGTFKTQRITSKRNSNNSHQRSLSHGSNHTSRAKTSNTTASITLEQPAKKRQTLPQTTEAISLEKLPLEIRAPNPAVSHEKFHTHITPTLGSLASRMNLISRFKPSQQTRDLYPLERGYWLIQNLTIIHADPPIDLALPKTPDKPTHIWTLAFFSQFWCFLRDFLVEGRAGWGVWCLLEACPDESNHEEQGKASTSSSSSSQSANIKPSSEQIKTVNLKIYTWGEVVPHIYMLLYLATERRIRNIRDVEWRDARDEVVIRM
ncbi:hypothetical protein BGW36DRAFT_363094 [Talaromyces proteolyticus]|uniref:Uncharacterized protein n=1 Tax=Talaromyces proteolyticus TaxID=1131652 RepID=A0AAD4PWJ7_9EURO|nr:uncharacterized protein BGW36DRAFT_363094 [Talaromyces proteolyticus]KAH8692082.1 hypothetical protein BGW36DRAFT_363094 [Talaromyces proteolyticus]